MKGRIKEIKHSDGRVEYLPEIKCLWYNVEYDSSVKELLKYWWVLFIPLANIVGLMFLLSCIVGSLSWQSLYTFVDEELTKISGLSDMEYAKKAIDEVILKINGEDEAPSKIVTIINYPAAN